MLVTFKSASHGDITMFGNVAKSLLRMMGLSGDVPGAIMAEDVAAVREKLTVNLQAAENPSSPASKTDTEESKSGSNDSDAEPPVSLSTRAIPLLAMLRSAADSQDNVMWE